MEHYAILGWGLSARSAYRYLVQQPHGDIRIYLNREEYERVYAEDPTLPLVYDTEDIREEVLIRSPGMRPDTPPILRALRRGARLTGEIELFIDACRAPVYAVTGSDGKTTTATLAARMCEAMGYTVHLGGNIGSSLLDRLAEIYAHHRVVLELSSFQLMGYAPTLACAAITNLSENHLNWHTDMEEYRLAKRNILLHAARRVINARMAEPLAALTFSACVPGANYHLSHGMLMHGEEPLISASAVKLRGIHNIENILCAAALTGADAYSVKAVGETFEGVRHRMSLCGIYRGVTCYDSSIDTTPTRTAATLAALPRGMTVLCGGAGKGLSYLPLVEALVRHAAHVVFTGETGEEMEAALMAYMKGTPSVTTVPRHLSGEGGCEASPLSHLFVPGFEAAVHAALEITPPGGTLVLSPAATSFDAFSSYRERGEVYRRCLTAHQND